MALGILHLHDSETLCVVWLQVTRDEFVLSNLLLLGKVDMTDVRESQKVFGE